MTFWDSYNAAVHSDSKLSDVEKFTYLKKTLVSKTAKEAIAGLTLNEGNKERIISKHMEALLNVEAVDSQGNTAALRALYDKVEIHTRELQTLGVAAEAYNCLLPSKSCQRSCVY